ASKVFNIEKPCLVLDDHYNMLELKDVPSDILCKRIKKEGIGVGEFGKAYGIT
ncbi:hypothetical protein ACJX0J_032781, partial [Zea mays]